MTVSRREVGRAGYRLSVQVATARKDKELVGQLMAESMNAYGPVHTVQDMEPILSLLGTTIIGLLLIIDGAANVIDSMLGEGTFERMHQAAIAKVESERGPEDT